jgi:hypothetical protein
MRRWLAVVVLVTGLAPVTADAHKFYVSLTTVEHNTVEQSLEITMRLFADDLEAAVAREMGKPLTHGQPGFDAAVFAVVRRALTVRQADGRPVTLVWVGLENKVDVTWVYVEAPQVPSTAGLTLRDTIFMDLFPEQVNMVHVKDARGRRAIDFRGGDSFKPF